MIDFRYHLVSIVAVFLALALGIVLGSTTLSQSVTNGLKQEANRATRRADDLRRTQQKQEAQLKGEEQFASTTGPQYVAGRLKGQSLVLVETPGAGEEGVSQVIDLATKAGATVTGRVAIQKKALDPDESHTLDELATQLKPAGTEFPSGADSYAKAGAVLASAIVTNDATKAGREDATGAGILTGFREAGYVTTSGKPGQHATLAVVIAPATPYGSDTAGGTRALVTLTSQLDAADRGTVLGGPNTAAQQGGLITALRDDSGVSKRVSSVDVLDTASGQVVAILALQNELGGKSGQYGVGPGANGGYLPSPPPPAAGKNG
ncbi:copper transporter [Actinomadura harenae]|uniref:Copper transporter n=1 Tax=Actinomadura harenae TaxID=2483351 RepID=A0A3M2LCH0_9ACTN|nr:copper transporter [Actinomadura harenae]RMI34786.1 copper transporter [Actinomadura harenae]